MRAVQPKPKERAFQYGLAMSAWGQQATFETTSPSPQQWQTAAEVILLVALSRCARTKTADVAQANSVMNSRRLICSSRII